MSTAMSTAMSSSASHHPRCVYGRFTSADVPSVEVLGYSLGRTLGSGTYAKVKAAWSPKHRRMIAIKILNKKAASKEYLSRFLPREMKILQVVRHSNIISVFELIETEKHAFFMLELAENGDLLDYINTRRYLPEPEARHIFKQMAGAIAYCHSLNIVHRDLKCENIMLSKEMDVKIGDFGFALHLEDSAAKTPCGSYSYAAPELFTSSGEAYDGKKADVWSLGVILYAMICGRLPFGDDSQVKKMQNRHLCFNKPLSLESRAFLHSLLHTNVDDRLNSTQMLIAEWPNNDSVKRPLPLIRPPAAKYTLENCLPPNVKFITQQQYVPPYTQQYTTYTACSSGPQYLVYAAGMQPYITYAPGQQYSSQQYGTYVCAPGQQLQYAHAPVHQYAYVTGQQQQQVYSPDQTACNQAPTAETCIVSTVLASQTRTPKPLVSKLGACGRRIADAVKHVGHHNNKHQRGGVPERSTT